MGNRIRTRPVAPYCPPSNMRMGPSERDTRAQAIRALQAVAGSLIYAVRTRDGLIKIGVTTNFMVRSQGIIGGVDEVLAFKAGTRDDEQAIHRSLAGHTSHGREYYYPTRAVLKVVNEMRGALGLDPVVHRPTL